MCTRNVKDQLLTPVIFSPEIPAVALYWLQTREEVNKRNGTYPVYRYTENIELAKRWVDLGEYARLVKGWRLPNGKYSLTDPAKANLLAVEPYRWPGILV